jgi:sirohydrochlorin cobaltochelatase
MKAVIVLAMHGGLPNDFPKKELAEYVGLHSRLAHALGAENTALERRYTELDAKIRHWTRTPKNDPFSAGSQELAVALRRASGRKVIIGFNEFCAPSLDQALDQAAQQKAEKIIVVTPMMTRGGEHAEVDIPAALRRAEERHPGIKYTYAWPFPLSEIAEFLSKQLDKFIS